METKKIELTATVEAALRSVSRRTDNLLSDECIKVLSNYSPNKATVKITKLSDERFNRLLQQIPEGIYTSVRQILSHITTANTRNNLGSISYSPLVSSYGEFNCCKILKYNKGHIITGRDNEIEQILLSMCKSSKRGVILVGEPGVGKSQPISEPVLAETGWKPMGKIQIGDKLFTPDGRLATVLGKFPQGIRKVFELEFSDGRKTRCSEEHLWKVYSKNWKRLGSESRVLELKTIKEIKDNTRERLYIDLPSPRLLPDKNHFIDPYTLGVLIGDGCIVNNARFTNSSDELIERVKIYLQVGYNLTISQQRTSKQIDIVRKKDNTGKNEYVSELKRLGLLGKKSYEKFIPEEYKNSSYGETIALLSGLLDIDGTVSANGCVQYYTTSKQLALDVQYLARSIGCIAKIKEKKTKYGYNGEMREGKLCHVVSISKQWPKELFTLHSKKEKLPNYLNRLLRLEISSIKEVEKEECECIYIDHSDHLYITRDFIVTHNTAIVNAINSRLIERTVPRQLLGAQILNLDIPYVFTKFKEDPMGTIIKVLERASSYDKVILFIDEVHQLLGHKMNDVMKPYLTEQIRFIGSTTVNEYHAIITDDVALERRFTLVKVEEPNIKSTISMVTKTKSFIEDSHQCTIPDEVCEYAVVNGSRFQGHRKNPDKSLDILDIACAIMSDKEVKEESVRPEATNDIVYDLELNKKEVASTSTKAGSRVLTKDYVNQAISSVTNIPYGEIKDSLDYGHVLSSISEKVIGQDKAIQTLANVVNIFKHVKYDSQRPVSVLLMVGPSGVGKKMAAKTLAQTLYGKDSSYIEFDMNGMTSEFMITELKGAPPGYVGYGKSGGLIKAIRNNPQSVIYFRGINRADDSIIQYVLDASRHGKIVDSAEREAGLNNAVIIYSVTLSDDEVERVFKGKSKSMGFGPTKKDEGDINRDELKKIVGEDLLKAVDETIIFNSLTKEHLSDIFEANITSSLELYDVDIDRTEVKEVVLLESKNGHDVVSKISSEVPKMVFQKLKQE